MSDSVETADKAPSSRGMRRSLQGVVVSTSMSKTLVVSVERQFKHKQYHKYIRRKNKVYAHDERGEARQGDVVSVIECRPMSKLKRFRLSRVISRAGGDQ